MTGPVFIVSTGRTGTTFLADFLSKQGIIALHEPGPQWLRWASNAYVSGHLDIERAQQLIDRARPKLPEAQTYVESSCLIYGLVEPLLIDFPDAQVVHIVRDPRTYVRSGMNWGAYRFGGRAKNLLPFRRLSPPQFEPWSIGARVQWMRLGQFERLSWAWAAMNRGIRKQGARFDRFRTIRFEDIVDPESGFRGLREIARLAGVDLHPDQLAEFGTKRVNAPRRSSFPPWQDWSDKYLRQLVSHCAEEALHYGYELDREINELIAARPRS